MTEPEFEKKTVVHKETGHTYTGKKVVERGRFNADDRAVLEVGDWVVNGEPMSSFEFEKIFVLQDEMEDDLDEIDDCGLSDIQRQVAQHSDGNDSTDVILSLQGELGSLSDFHSMYLKDTSMDEYDGDGAPAVEGILESHLGRLVITIAEYANENGVDLEDSFERVFEEWSQDDL